MKKELDDKLCTTYPLIFSLRNGDKRVAPMAWGFQCGDGWYPLINKLCSVIQHHIDSSNEHRQWLASYNHMIDEALAGNLGPIEQKYPNLTHEGRMKMVADRTFRTEEKPLIVQLVAGQVKEKFGGLRFYVHKGGDEFTQGAIALAESLSFTICDVCGNPGKVGNQSLTFDEPKRDGVHGYYATRCRDHWGYREEI